MKTTAIIGSPRKGGNCDLLVNELIEKIEGETKIYSLQDMNIKYCIACQECQTKDCIQNDDINTIMK